MRAAADKANAAFADKANAADKAKAEASAATNAANALTAKAKNPPSPLDNAGGLPLSRPLCSRKM